MVGMLTYGAETKLSNNGNLKNLIQRTDTRTHVCMYVRMYSFIYLE